VFCNGDVQAVAFSDDKLIAGGHFLTVDLQPAPRLAALTLGGALVAGWHPLPDKPVWALQGSATDVYVGGAFLDVSAGSTTVTARHFAEFHVS